MPECRFHSDTLLTTGLPVKHFMTLADAEEACEALSRQLDMMLGIQAGMTIMLQALLAKHPGHDQVQLLMTSTLERAIAGSFSTALSPAAQEAARTFVESLQQTQAVLGEIDPLRILRGTHG